MKITPQLRLLILFLIALPFLNSYAQVEAKFINTKIKAEMSPLEPLQAGKTYNLGLPDGMIYLKNKAEVRPYWDPFGMSINIKWDTKSETTDYTFRMVMPGLKIVSVQTKIVTTGRQQYIRDYTVQFPARLEVVDNATNTVIRTVEINTDEQQWTRTFHKNYFNTDTFDPNYGKVIGFDSLTQLNRITERDGKVMAKMEGDMASETFEKIKTVLVHLYGQASFKADFAILTPKEKGKATTYAAYTAMAEKLKTAIDLYNKNTQDAAAISVFQEADKFYTGAIESGGDTFVDYLPAMLNWNLAMLKLLTGEIAVAEEYYGKITDWGKLPMGNIYLKPAFPKAKDFLEARVKLLKK